MEKGKQGLAWMVLVGGEVDDDGLRRSVGSVLPHVDHLYVHWNAAEHAPTWLADDPKVTLKVFAWQDDFALARNELFDMVDREKYTWAGWSDADDEVIGADQLRRMLAERDSETQCVWLNYVYAWNRDTRHTEVEHWRERIFRLDTAWSWGGPIHENCVSSFAVQQARVDDVWIRHWREDTPERNAATRRRNRKIITRMRREEPDAARWAYLNGNELYAEAQLQTDDRERDALYDAALTEYREFISEHPASDDAYVANNRMAEIIRQKGELNESVNQDLQGVKLRPTWPDSWVSIAESMIQAKEFGLARDFADIAIRVGVRPVTVQVWEPTTLSYTPYVFRGIGKDETGDLAGALEDFEHAYEVLPNAGLAERIAEVKERLAAPRVDRKAQRKATFGSGGEKSIAFVTRPLFEPWHPVTIGQQGSGGAEWCLIEIARRFRRDGWRVAVFGTPGEHRGPDEDGIEWWDAHEFLATEPFEVVVAVRAPEVFDNTLRAKTTVLWMHDVTVGDMADGPFGDRFARPDVVLALSSWHRAHLAKVYGVAPERQRVVPNGYDPALFHEDASVERDAFRMVWASSPDRGLENLLEQWPMIRHRWPEAELDVFYGWTAINKLIALQGADSRIARFKGRVEQLLEETGGEAAGVHWRDRQPRAVLAEEYRKATVWAYPTTFCETFCITALEMQASGVIPVTSRLGALSETVGRPDLRVPGLAGNAAYRRQWLEVLRRVVEGPESLRVELRRDGAAHAAPFTWDASYEVWRAVLAERGVAVAA